MKNPLRKPVRLAIEKCGFRIFPQKTFYRNFVPYNRYGTDFIHYVRHFADIRGITTCFDVGANKGQTATYFTNVFPGSTVYSFEPVRRTYGQLVANTKQNPRVKRFNFAFGRAPGMVDIALAEDDQTNSLIPAKDRHVGAGSQHESIEVRTIDAFMGEQGIDRIHLLKTDTEGFDLEVLNGASKAFSEQRIDLVYSEVGFHPDDRQHTYFDDVLQFLLAHDFAFLGLYDTVYCDCPTHILHANALFGRKSSPVITPWAD